MTKLDSILNNWKNNPGFMANVSRWEIIPASSGIFSEIPASIDNKLHNSLNNRGITKLYSHQEEAITSIEKGNHTVIVSPTASGKTLCYNLPVVNQIIRDQNSRALYLFPTKALSQDQVAELRELCSNPKIELNCHTYDGDTEPGLRQRIRKNGQVIVTNPDMLHSAILPHHTKWVQLFQNLQYIVVDEMHQYRGVFGSHVANVIRRLKRICSFYGSNPRFILCSATIDNPGELGKILIEEPLSVIAKNGSPQAEKHFILYNPPLVNPELGLRRSTLLEAKLMASELIRKNIQTIVFTRSRLGVEVLLTYLRQGIKTKPGDNNTIMGYRGGYLPHERRSIETGLRKGNIKGVVSTNALELGIDLGALDACIITGYPGSIASTWQQAGRSGRRSGVSLAMLIANNEPLNQYMINNPDYFFSRSPERALADPDNLIILTNHIRCAAFELPFSQNDMFGSQPVQEILEFLENEEVLHFSDGRYHWMEDSYPAEEISLRSATRENVIIIDITKNPSRVIGEVDRFSAPMLVHEEAIYIHGGNQYQVEKLDFQEKKAFVRQVEVNYFTDANLAVDLKVLDTYENDNGLVSRAHGEVRVNALVSMFKKIRFNTHENLGSGPVDLPETEMHTTAFWLAFNQQALKNLSPAEVQSALIGLANLAPQVASLYLMGEPRDLCAVSQVKGPFTNMPTLFLYDNFPGGVGYSREIFHVYQEIFKAAREVIEKCICTEGCPSCVGPSTLVDVPLKKPALELLELILS